MSKAETDIPEEKWGVHIGHCCTLHGCKYGNESCPVSLGLAKQEHPCEYCSMRGLQEVNQITELLALQTDIEALDASEIAEKTFVVSAALLSSLLGYDDEW